MTILHPNIREEDKGCLRILWLKQRRMPEFARPLARGQALSSTSGRNLHQLRSAHNDLRDMNTSMHSYPQLSLRCYLDRQEFSWATWPIASSLLVALIYCKHIDFHLSIIPDL